MQPQRPKTLAELEAELAPPKAAQALQTHLHPSANPIAQARKLLARLIGIGVVLGIPVGALWMINLPYSPIRRPIARTAPILLLPSYISIDENYRDAIALVEQSDQLINQVTSDADIELGEQKVMQAQESLEALPISFLYEFPEYRSWWYSWRFSPAQFDHARIRISELEAKVFQEKNARTLLVDAEAALTQAKQPYQQATTMSDKQSAIAAWRSALAQFEQIPSATFAGRSAQQKLVVYQREFEETVGLAAQNAQVASIIEAARGFAWEAAKLGQNPPHSAAEWQQIESLWMEAIAPLERIPPEDVVGYAEAQQLLATYRSNLGQVKIRRQAETDSVKALQLAQQQIQALQASTPDNADDLNRNRTISQLEGIVNQLHQVENGTTAYAEAQRLLFFAQNKLKELQP
ncbi:MAG: hypothetical protein VKJ64_09610 [Leptolyngbyaceae bacterium]|nr:hypothetical protein [Leptolyngbyaceae bacterium]